MHLTVDMYELLLRGVLEPWQLVDLAHDHTLEECARCREQWERFVGGREGLDLAGLDPRPRHGETAAPRDLPPLPELPDDPDELSVQDHARWSGLMSAMRRETRRARQDVKELLELPPEAWADRVDDARTRFRSRACAQLLLAESRRRVVGEPRLAARLAALVPRVLRWLPAADGAPWAWALHARAEAYRANAERVAGDLPAAAERFRALRRRLRRRPLEDGAAAAEIDSLEASLWIDQRRFSAARDLLRRAVAGARRCGHRRVLRRALIITAIVHRIQGRPEEALDALAAARELDDPHERSYERACFTGTRVLALCDLGRYQDAARLLDAEEEVFEVSRHSAAYRAGMRGRVALGLERWAEAADRFRAARAALLELGRDYDAALTCLDLAHAHLGAGDTARLRQLAVEIVPLFQARDVERETLAVLRLLAEAAAQDRATDTLVSELRRRLHAGRSGNG